MDYFSLKCFVEVVRCGSFTRAADALLRTQPAVSQQIRNLEEIVGRPLFDRTRKKVVLTEDGRKLLGVAEDLVCRFETLPESLALSTGPLNGTLRLASSLSLSGYLLPDLLERFRVDHPEVKVTLVNQAPRKILGNVLLGRSEIGISSGLGKHPLLERKTLFRDSILLLRPKGEVLPPLICFERGTPLRSAGELLVSKGLAGPVRLEVQSYDLIRTYLHRGWGAAVLPSSVLKPEDRELFRVDPLPDDPGFAVEALRHRDRPSTRAGELFWNSLPRV